MAVQLHRPVRVEAPPDRRRRPTPHALPALVVTGKVILLLAVVRIFIDPAWGNLEGSRASLTFSATASICTTRSCGSTTGCTS